MIAKEKSMNINKLSKDPLQIPLQVLSGLYTPCKEKNSRKNQDTVTLVKHKTIVIIQPNNSLLSSNEVSVVNTCTHLQNMGFVWSW